MKESESATGASPKRRSGALKLFGVDRRGSPPQEVAADAPLRPWTWPNLITAVRLASIPVFLVLGLSGDAGRVSLTATVIFAAAAVSDYVDGFIARLTGQYSRLGRWIDPLVDRLLVVSAAVVAWSRELLPAWALAVLVVREIATVVMARMAMARHLEIEVNWLGRLSVWPLLCGFGGVLLGLESAGRALFLVGVGMAVGATVLYARSAFDVMRSRQE